MKLIIWRNGQCCLIERQNINCLFGLLIKRQLGLLPLLDCWLFGNDAVLELKQAGLYAIIVKG